MTNERNRGFTLIELLVVLAVTAILIIALGAVWISNRPHYRLTAAARDLASDMRYARQLAVSRTTQARISFSPTAGEAPPGCAGPAYVVRVEVVDSTCSLVWLTVGDNATQLDRGQCSGFPTPPAPLGLPSICRRMPTGDDEYLGVTLTAPATDPLCFQPNGTVTDDSTDATRCRGPLTPTVTATLTQAQGAAAGETRTVTLTAGGSVAVPVP